jgi:hypothetical protein
MAEREDLEFTDGPREHVANAAPVEVSGGGVTHRVAVAPAVERREHQQPEHPAQPRVRPPRGQERPVRAVMEDHVRAQQ